MRKTTLWLLTLTVVIGTCEGSARFAYFLAYGHAYSSTAIAKRLDVLVERQSDAKANERGSSVRTHPYYGFIACNKAELTERRGFENVTAAQLGFSDDVPIFHAPEDTFLVVILGGSVASYFAIAKANALNDILEKRPEFSGRKARLLNLALPGYKEPQQLLILSDLMAMGMHPDVVLNIDGFNEDCIAWGNVQNKIFPFMPWFWINNDAPSRQQVLTLGRIDFLQSLRTAIAERLSKAPALPAVVGFPAAALDRLCDRAVGDLERALVADSVGSSTMTRQRLSAGGGIYLGPNVVIAPQGFSRIAARQWARASVLMNNMVRAAGGRYFHALQPIQPQWAQARGENPGLLCQEPCASAGFPVLAEYGVALKNAGVRFADMAPAMVNTPLAFLDCCHVTPAGQEALFNGVLALLQGTFTDTVPEIDADKALRALTWTPPPFSGADLLAAPVCENVVTENLYGIERSNEGPYRSVFGEEAVICIFLGAPVRMHVNLGFKESLPDQNVVVNLNGASVATYHLDKSTDKVADLLDLPFTPGLNTLAVRFSRHNDGPDKNPSMRDGYAAQFFALSLNPAP